MASERDFELLDDYLRNRLSDGDKSMFENRLQADPDLQRELKLQQSIVESIRQARAAELKAMLNNIPPSAIPGQTSAVAKWGALAVSVLVAVGLYFYLQPERNSEMPPVTDSATVVTPSEPNEPAVETATEELKVADETSSVKEESKENGHAPSKKTQPAPGTSAETKPRKMDVFDPTVENTEESVAPEVKISEGATTSAKASDITSEVVNDHKTYTFHYQFRDDKLILYGAFDKNLYSILEFFSDNKRTIFLEYKNNFYLLNQAGDKVKPLSPVNDPVLIQKLREH